VFASQSVSQFAVLGAVLGAVCKVSRVLGIEFRFGSG